MKTAITLVPKKNKKNNALFRLSLNKALPLHRFLMI